MQSPLGLPVNGAMLENCTVGTLPDVAPCPFPCGGQIDYDRALPGGFPVRGRVYPRS